MGIETAILGSAVLGAASSRSAARTQASAADRAAQLQQEQFERQVELQPSEVYTFPEIVGQVLNAGDFISTIAGTATSVNIRASGREVS